LSGVGGLLGTGSFEPESFEEIGVGDGDGDGNGVAEGVGIGGVGGDGVGGVGVTEGGGVGLIGWRATRPPLPEVQPRIIIRSQIPSAIHPEGSITLRLNSRYR
jgi:hypothetical protein